MASDEDRAEREQGRPGSDGSDGSDGSAQGTRSKLERTLSVLPYVASLLWPRRGVLALAVALLVLSRALGLVMPASIQYLVDQVIGHGRLALLAWIAAAILAATAGQGVTGWVTSRMLTRLSQGLVTELRRDVHWHVLGLPAVFFDVTSVGTLVSRVMHDVYGVESLCGAGLVSATGSVLTAGLAFAVLLRLDWVMAVSGAGVLAAFLAAMAAMSWKTKRPYQQYVEIYGRLTSRLTEAFGGIRVLKTSRAERRERAAFAAMSERLSEALRRGQDVSAVAAMAGSAFLGVATALVVYVGVHRLLGGVMTLGQLLTFVAFLGVFVGAVLGIVGFVPEVARAVVGLERIREVLAEPPEDGQGAGDGPSGRSVRLGRIRGAIEFERVGFAYPSGRQALRGVSFRAEPGTVTAVVGRSGAGKSTLAALVASLYVPAEGRILVDGVDLSTVTLDSYRAQVGLVLQDTFLFDGTIRDNVALARPEAPESAIVEACRAAYVEEFAQGFGAGYETRVGERGVALSAGQRQRIAIARALLVDPPVLILDEPTSSLDSESERYVREALARLTKGRTTLLVAHGLSAVRDADQTLVLEAGRIAERGTHAALLAMGGTYRAMFGDCGERQGREPEASESARPGRALSSKLG